MLAALAAASALNACALLTPAEIAAQAGETPKESRPASQSPPGLEVRSCVYVLPTFANSVSLEVDQFASAAQAKQHWRVFFVEGKGAEGSEKEAGEGKPLARRAVRGLGGPSLWVSEKPSPALYAQRGRSIVRLSLGGAKSPADKLKRAKALMQRALARLKTAG